MTDDTATTKPRAEMPAGETFLSLNGYDELAIVQAFGTTVGKLRSEDEQSTFMRAMAFIDKRRKLQGQSSDAHAEAHAFAMDMTLTEVMGYFAADDDSEDSDQGEGDGR